MDPTATAGTVNAVVIGGAGKDVVQQTTNVLSDRSSEADTVLD